MLSLAPALRVFLHTAPVDFRRGFDGLAGVVRDDFGDDPLSGHLFVFRNRRADRVKILFWDRDGFWLLYKRLERGTFRFPRAESGRIEVEAVELAFLLEGVDLAKLERQERYRYVSQRRSCVA